MGFHTYNVENAERLNDPTRYSYLSTEELIHAIQPTREDIVLDIGSGTGFYTDTIAEHTATVAALDIQTEMHQIYLERGKPRNVDLVTAEIAKAPLRDNTFDKAFSTMTYHEYASREANQEVYRALKPGARLVIADWTSNAEPTSGPPIDERFNIDEATDMLRETGFEIQREAERTETYIIEATKPR